MGRAISALSREDGVLRYLPAKIIIIDRKRDKSGEIAAKCF